MLEQVGRWVVGGRRGKKGDEVALDNADMARMVQSCFRSRRSRRNRRRMSRMSRIMMVMLTMVKRMKTKTRKGGFGEGREEIDDWRRIMKK